MQNITRLGIPERCNEKATDPFVVKEKRQFPRTHVLHHCVATDVKKMFGSCYLCKLLPVWKHSDPFPPSLSIPLFSLPSSLSPFPSPSICVCCVFWLWIWHRALQGYHHSTEYLKVGLPDNNVNPIAYDKTH